MNQSCESCRNTYQGDDGHMRCRVHSNGLKCSPEAADGCKKFERYAGAEDAPWFANGWCLDQGRGD